MTAQPSGSNSRVTWASSARDRLRSITCCRSFLAPRLHLRTELLVPLSASARAPQCPANRHAPVGHRKRSEFRGVDGQLMQREPKILRRFRLERDRRAVDGDLRFATAAIGGQLRFDEFAQRCPVPTLAHQQVVRRGQRLQSRAELVEKSLDRTGMTGGLPRHRLDHASRFFERCVSSRISSRKCASLSLRSVTSIAAQVRPTIWPASLRRGSIWRSCDACRGPHRARIPRASARQSQAPRVSRQ